MQKQPGRRSSGRTIYRTLGGLLVLGLALFALWTFTPALYDRQVDEAFPAAPTAAQAASSALPTAQLSTASPPAATAVPTAQAQAAPTVAAPTTAAAPTTVAEAQPVALVLGSFVAGSVAGDRAEGSATIYRLADGTRVLRLEDFAATNGPDLVVTLHPAANPEQDKGEYLQLAALKGNQGNQNYALPADVDISKYQSVVIWCRTFNVVFGYATLRPAA